MNIDLYAEDWAEQILNSTEQIQIIPEPEKKSYIAWLPESTTLTNKKKILAGPGVEPGTSGL